MVLIGILGKRGHGKDTIGDYLQKNHEFKKDSFAFPLKESVRILFGLNDEQLYGSLKEVVDPYWNVTPREIMQKYGTEIVRNHFGIIIKDIGNNFWVRSLVRRYNDVKNTTNVVVCDVRFKNEVDEIHKQGGIIIKIDRPPITSISKTTNKIYNLINQFHDL